MRLPLLLFIFAALSILVVFSSQPAYAATFTLSDQASCQAAPFSGTWVTTPPTCQVAGFVINAGDFIVINSGITLDNMGTIASGGSVATITNNGVINNEGPLTSTPHGTISNFITINNNIGATIINSGRIDNDEAITNLGSIINTGNIFDAGFAITNTGTLTNSGTMTLDVPTINTGMIINSGMINVEDGTINNNSGGTITNNLGGTINLCCDTGNSGTINNFGTFATTSPNVVTINNPGTINNCGAGFLNFIITGNSIVSSCNAPATFTTQAEGGGLVTFTTSAGGFGSLPTAVPKTSLTPQPPTGLYPFGFFSWTITGLSPSQTVILTITYPGPPGSTYEKLIGGTWNSIPVSVSCNVATLTVTDGGLGDADQKVNGQISDPGGIGTLSVLPTGTAVGGEILPIDMTSLFVAGAMTNAFWVVPTLGGIAGAVITLLKVKRKPS